MSKLNHTPGKWHYVDYSPQFNGCFPVYDIRDDNVSCVAEVVHTESNARLIAAAPDMLDALVVAYRAIPIDSNGTCVVLGHGTKDCPLCKIKAAIESATGLPIEEVLK